MNVFDYDLTDSMVLQRADSEEDRTDCLDLPGNGAQSQSCNSYHILAPVCRLRSLSFSRKEKKTLKKKGSKDYEDCILS